MNFVHVLLIYDIIGLCGSLSYMNKLDAGNNSEIMILVYYVEYQTNTTFKATSEC